MLEFSTKKHRTRILPLRWVANALNRPATYCLIKAVNMDEDEEYGWRYKMYGMGWKYLNAPYERWGTYYTIDMDGWREKLTKDEVLDRLGSDYDEDGIPYWEKWNNDKEDN